MPVIDEGLVLAFMADIRGGNAADPSEIRTFLRDSTRATLDEAVRRLKEEKKDEV